MTGLEAYYNKFNEEKRLDSRHGQVEFITSMTYIHRCLEKLAAERTAKGGTSAAPETAAAEKGAGEAGSNAAIRILDIGAGTGRYAVPLWQEGYSVTAVELVKHNLSRLQKKGPGVKGILGNALNLKKLEDDSFDLTLLFGPMYHLTSEEEKKQALSEALRVTRPGGYLLVAYIMNEYAVVRYGFKEGHILSSLEQGELDRDFHVRKWADDLYSVVRLSDINAINEACGARRVGIISADGPANYMRRELNALSEEEFEAFVRYHLSTCELPELLGAGAHTVDILQKYIEELL